MLTSDFNFDLPQELIAQHPSGVRGQDKLMLLNRTSGIVEHFMMDDLPKLIQPGTLMVFNNSRVRRARVYGIKETTGREEIDAPILFFDDGKTALIETAKVNGLPLVKGRENPEETSTYGIGQLIGHAVDLGAKKIILALGGSCTNDCGLGMLAALGACFYNKDGVSFVPTGGTLCEVADIDLSMMYPR